MVSVIIAARNEADRIAATVTAARALPAVGEVIVVDDGSTDTTKTVAETAGAMVLVHPKNQGKAAAMQTGAQRAGGELLLFLDADLGATAREAAKLILPVQSGDADMSIATFPTIPGRGGGRGIVVRTARRGILHFTGQTMRAPLSGQRCLNQAAWKAAIPLASGFGVETAMTIRVLRAGLKIIEVETQMDHRVTGSDWQSRRHRLRQLRDVVQALWRIR